jgi:tetratricopeptide (TPR) repeat protein
MRFFRQPILVAALFGVAVAVPALAQTSQYPAPCEATKVSKAEVDRAHTLYLSGKLFLDESNYDKAISYFKDAYSIDCSVHGILPIIATAYERKGDKLEAIHALEEYLKRAPTASDREIIERRVANLKAQVASSSPTAAPSPSATSPNPPATATPTATSAATTPTSEPSTTPTTVPSSGPPSGGHSIAPWVVVGVGGAAAITGVVLFLVGSGNVSDAANRCVPPGSHTNCPQDAVDEGNNGRTLETVGGIMGGIGAAAVAGGLVWHFLEPKSPAPGTAIAPTVGPGFAGLSVAGRF